MSVSTLTIPTPESCRVCPLVKDDHDRDKYYCIGDRRINADGHIHERHPDCPLRIQQEGLKWLNLNGGCVCPQCSEGYQFIPRLRYCPSCGVKLDPLEEVNDVSCG